jgi:hypothetical protein
LSSHFTVVSILIPPILRIHGLRHATRDQAIKKIEAVQLIGAFINLQQLRIAQEFFRAAVVTQSGLPINSSAIWLFFNPISVPKNLAIDDHPEQRFCASIDCPSTKI